MDSDAKYAAIVVAVLLALILITTSGRSSTPDDYPSDMDACIYTGVGGWDC